MTNKKNWADSLPRGACDEALVWARTQPDLATAWVACQRGDWMLWLAGRWAGPVGSASRLRLVQSACACARLALPYVRQGHTLVAIETAEAYCRGEATLDQVRTAANAASLAVNAATTTTAYVAANAAAYAAWAATAVASVAANAAAAYAATAAATATATATIYGATAAATTARAADDADAARARVLAQCANLVRGIYPTPPEEGGEQCQDT